MILDIAADLLNENFSINEAADAVARQGVARWLKNDFPYIKFGKNPEDIETDENDNQLMNADGTPLNRTNIQSIFDKANFEFGHPLNAGLEHRMKFTEKYLPGAVRIAFTDCGWMTPNENKRMMTNLKNIYAALFFNWWDGCEYTWVDTGSAETSHWEARNPSYKGLIVGATEAESADFNGMSYKELYAKFKDLIPGAIERLAQQSRGAEEPEEAPAPVIRNNTPYKIEYIPDFETSKTWKKYTNQVQAGSAGCTWCITSSRSFWNDYGLGNRNFAYFCWKAPSLDALKEMNIMDSQPGHYYSFCARDASSDEINNAPMNEYGLSLIAVMVYDDGSGEPRFRQATSRYNHYAPDGEWHNGMYGDNLVPQDSDEGYNKILRILEMDDAEFKRTFKLPNSSGVTHDDIMEKIKTAREQHNLAKLFDDLVPKTRYSNRNGLIIRDHNQDNFIRSDGTLLSNTWFTDVSPVISQNDSFVLLQVKRNNKYNIVTPEGRYLLEQDVYGINYSDNRNYAQIRVKPNLYNVINLNTGLMLLKKPVSFVLLQDNYTKGIFIKNTLDEPYKLINLAGKVIYETSNPQETIVNGIKDTYSTKSPIGDGNKVNIKIVNASNGKIIWRKSNVDSEHNYIFAFENAYYINIPSKSLDLISYTGKVILHYDGPHEDIKYDPQSYIHSLKTDYIKIYDYNTSSGRIFNVKTGEEIKLATTEFNIKNITYIDNDIMLGEYNRKFYKFKSSTGELLSETDYFDHYSGAIYTVKENGEYKLINAVTDKVIKTSTQPFTIAYNTLHARHGAKYLIITVDRKYYIFDNNLDQVNEVDIPVNSSSVIFYIGYDCYAYESTDNNGRGRCNILGPNGRWLFKHPFSSFQGRYFNDNGIICIKAGNKDYFVNADGDVSRSVEALSESFVNEEEENLILESEETENKPDNDVVYLSSLFMN